MKKKDPSFGEAASLLIVIIACIAYCVIVVQMPATVAILFVLAVLTAYVAIRYRSFDKIHKGIVEGIKPGIIPIIIFILVGALIAVWIQAGIIPTLMVYGFHILRAEWFVPTVFLVCAIVGSAVGSAFTIMSTIGIAFFGIGMTMGIYPPLVVGAIVSGAVFGDKMSPLSESTNLAAAVVEADLFDHIKNLMWSTVPAFIVSLILYAVVGHTSTSANLETIDRTIAQLKDAFFVSPVALVPILVMFLCAWKKVPAIATIFINIVLGLVMSSIETKTIPLKEFAQIIDQGFVATTPDEQINALLSRGGISSMLPTIALIILALSLGGILIETKIISTVLDRLIPKLNSTFSLIFSTLLASIGVNIFIGEQFLSVILPGNAFKELYKEKHLAPVVLSRTLEDGGTVINYLIPWGIAGSFVASTFGIPVLTFAPFVFFSLLSPIFSIVSGLTGIGVKKIQA